MKSRSSRQLAMAIVIAVAALAFILRLLQLSALDMDGRFPARAGLGLLTWLCLAITVTAGVCAWRLQPAQQLCGSSAVVLAMTLAAAFLTALAGAALWTTNKLSGLCRLLTAVCLVVIGLQRRQRSSISALWFMLPAMFQAAELIAEFRYWSKDPQILDYCFKLFASIFALLANYHLAGFYLGRSAGKRTFFYCLMGAVFSIIAIAGEPAILAISMGGTALWLLVNLWLVSGEDGL